ADQEAGGAQPAALPGGGRAERLLAAAAGGRRAGAAVRGPAAVAARRGRRPAPAGGCRAAVSRHPVAPLLCRKSNRNLVRLFLDRGAEFRGLQIIKSAFESVRALF